MPTKLDYINEIAAVLESDNCPKSIAQDLYELICNKPVLFDEFTEDFDFSTDVEYKLTTPILLQVIDEFYESKNMYQLSVMMASLFKHLNKKQYCELYHETVTLHNNELLQEMNAISIIFLEYPIVAQVIISTACEYDFTGYLFEDLDDYSGEINLLNRVLERKEPAHMQMLQKMANTSLPFKKRSRNTLKMLVSMIKSQTLSLADSVQLLRIFNAPMLCMLSSNEIIKSLNAQKKVTSPIVAVNERSLDISDFYVLPSHLSKMRISQLLHMLLKQKKRIECPEIVIEMIPEGELSDTSVVVDLQEYLRYRTLYKNKHNAQLAVFDFWQAHFLTPPVETALLSDIRTWNVLMYNRRFIDQLFDRYLRILNPDFFIALIMHHTDKAEMLIKRYLQLIDEADYNIQSIAQYTNIYELYTDQTLSLLYGVRSSMLDPIVFTLIPFNISIIAKSRERIRAVVLKDIEFSTELFQAVLDNPIAIDLLLARGDELFFVPEIARMFLNSHTGRLVLKEYPNRFIEILNIYPNLFDFTQLLDSDHTGLPVIQRQVNFTPHNLQDIFQYALRQKCDDVYRFIKHTIDICHTKFGFVSHFGYCLEDLFYKAKTNFIGLSSSDYRFLACASIKFKRLSPIDLKNLLSSVSYIIPKSDFKQVIIFSGSGQSLQFMIPNR